MISYRLRLYPLPFLMFGGFAGALFAKAFPSSKISGVVSDSNAGVIARVKAIQTDTGLERATITATDGTYALPNLPVRTVSPYSCGRWFSHLCANRNHPPSQHQSDSQCHPGRRLVVPTGRGQCRRDHGGDADQQGLSGDRSAPRSRSSAQWPAAHAIDLLSGAAVTAPSSDMASSKNYPTSVTIAVAGGQANGSITCSTAATTTMRSARLICHSRSPTRYRNLVSRPMPFRPATVSAPAP